MNKKLTILSILFYFTITSANLFAQFIPEKPFLKEVEKEMKRGKGIFNLNLDVQLGLTISNTNFELNRVNDTTRELNSTSSKVGPSFGAVLSVDFMGVGFTSGMQYSSKGFQTTNGEKTNLNYFNIPLLFYFDFDLDEIIIDGNFGPYFGLLISDDESTVYKVKNFDFGLTGNIQGAYLFQKHLGALLGFKYEYGGLNNLGNNEYVKSIRTSTFYIYTGLKFIL